MVECMFNDPGMSGQLKALYSTPDWHSGKTIATLVATIKDYMGDVQVGHGYSVVRPRNRTAAIHFVQGCELGESCLVACMLVPATKYAV